MPKSGPRLCTSVSADSPRELAEKASLALSLGSDLVELRIDRLTKDGSRNELRAELSAFAKKSVITVRSSREGGAYKGREVRRLGLLSSLAELGPAYLDVELATVRENRKWADSLPKDVKKIVSWHDFKGTPEVGLLRSICEEELGQGSLAKVVTTAKSADDNLRTLELCAENPAKVISFCMGDLGTISRVVSMWLGAPLVYASVPDEAVAPGQLSISTMRKLRSMVAYR